MPTSDWEWRHFIAPYHGTELCSLYDTTFSDRLHNVLLECISNWLRETHCPVMSITTSTVFACFFYINPSMFADVLLGADMDAHFITSPFRVICATVNKL